MVAHSVSRVVLRLAVFLVVLLVATTPSLLATDSVYRTDLLSISNWSDALFWSDGVPNGTDDVARFPNLIGRDCAVVCKETIKIDSGIPGDGVTLGSLYLSRSEDAVYVIEASGGKSLILDSSTGKVYIESISTCPGIERAYYDQGHYIKAPLVFMKPLTVHVDGDRENANGAQLALSPRSSTGAGITKTGDGVLWFPSSSVDYSGPTVVEGGILRCESYTYYFPEASNIVLAGGVLDGGYQGMGIYRDLGTGPGQIRWTGSGGFGNYSGTTISIGGKDSPVQLRWGVGGFVPDGCELILGHPWGQRALEFRNPINLNSGIRTIRADGSNYTREPECEISGSLSNGGLTKVGSGTLALSGTNTYSRPTTIAAGSLAAVEGVGLPSSSNLVLAGGLYRNRDTAVTFTRGLGSGPGQVQWTGSGGFAGNLTVNIGGSATPDTLTWDQGGFVPDGSELVLRAPEIRDTLVFANPLDLAGHPRTVRVPDDHPTGLAHVTLTSAITGGAGSALVKAGEGTLLLGASDLIADSVGVTASEGTLDFQDYDDTVGTVTLNGGTIIGSGTLTASSYDIRSGTATVHLAGAADLLKTTPGHATITHPGDYSGDTTITEGTLEFSNGDLMDLPSGNICLAGGVQCLVRGTTLTCGLGTGDGQIQWTASGGFAARSISGYAKQANVNLGNGSPLVWGAGGFVPDGCELFLQSLDGYGTLNLMNPIDLAGATRTVRIFTANPGYQAGGVLSGTLSNGGLMKTGPGFLRLTGTNSYSGPTIVSEGTLAAKDGTGLPLSSNLVLAGGAFAMSGTFTRSLGTGPGQVQWTGSGGFARSSATHMPMPIINLGGLATPGTVTWGENHFVPLGHALQLGYVEFQNPIDLNGGTRTVMSIGGISDLSGSLSNGGLMKTGPGRLLLSGTNTFDGDVTVAEGRLDVGGASALGSAVGKTIVRPGATLTFYKNPDLTISGEPLVLGRGPGGTDVLSTLAAYDSNPNGDITWTGPVTTEGDGTIVNQSRCMTFSGPVHLGDGVLTLEGRNYHRGGTVFSGEVSGSGTLGVGYHVLCVLSGTSTYTGTTVVHAGGRLRVDSPSAFPQGPIVTGGAVEFLVADGTVDFGQTMLGHGNLTKSGAGTLVLSGTNTYSDDTRVTEGSLRATSGAGLPTESKLSFAGGVLECMGPTAFTRSLGSSGSDVLQWWGSGGFAAHGGKTVVAIGGTASPTLLTWDDTHCIPDGSALMFGSITADSETEFTNPLDLAAGTRTVTVNDNPASTGDFATMLGAISNGSLTKDGPGRLVLGGNHTYTGATTVAAGTLGIAADTTLATALFDVAAGATLDVRDAEEYVLGPGAGIKGGGTVLGNLLAHGTVAPGESPGVLSVDDITFGPTSTLEIEIGGEVRGTQYDVLVSSGDIVLQDGSSLSVLLIDPYTPDEHDAFDIMDFSSITGHFTTCNLPALGADLSWNTDELYTNGTIRVVPEPATLTILLLGGLALARRRQP